MARSVRYDGSRGGNVLEFKVEVAGTDGGIVHSLIAIEGVQFLLFLAMMVRGRLVPVHGGRLRRADSIENALTRSGKAERDQIRSDERATITTSWRSDQSILNECVKLSFQQEVGEVR